MSGQAPSAPERVVPRATYRLQLHGQFTLPDALRRVPYLHALGISHLYVSPLTSACPGSTHGYDVCDPTRLNPELGTEEDLAALVAELRRRGMGLVVDIVPNHMGICGPHNPWWWDLLKHGPASRFARYFDVEWEAPIPDCRGRVLLPVLGDLYGRVLARGEVKLVRESGEIRVAYHQHRFPLDPETLPDTADLDDPALAALSADPEALHALLERQHYSLAWWRRGLRELNYRRFFDIASLAGVRVEDPEVFEAGHTLIRRWYEKGWIDGLRVDHPDGLRDPTAYFQRLRALAPGAWIVAEKILQPDETLPEDWPVDGTTGYEFIRRVTGLFVDPSGEGPLTDFYARFTGEPAEFARVLEQSKRLVLDDLLVTEMNRLVRLLQDLTERHWRLRDLSAEDLRTGLTELICQLPVYRTYVQPSREKVAPHDETMLACAFENARRRHPALPAEVFDLLEQVLRLRISGPVEEEFLLRFQQLTGPAMAKGAEDTACYRFNRLIALNTVGGDPARFGLSPETFLHECRESAKRWPHSMLATSTHDTKRAGDVRIRICLLSEIPDRWEQAVRTWSAMNEKYRLNGWPDRNLEYFYYQTLFGAWPISADRARTVMVKAAREAKQHTSWLQPNTAYEQALEHFVCATLADTEFLAAFEAFLQPILEAWHIHALGQTLLKLTAPGVPDFYQGDELWELSLVDPDNRRPVDFDLRERMLQEMTSVTVEEIWRRRKEGWPKLWVIQRTLQLRKEHPDAFRGDAACDLAEVRGSKAAHVLALLRGQRIAAVVPRLVLRRGGDWGDTTVSLPEGRWTNFFTGTTLAGGTRPVQEWLGPFPVALWLRKDSA
ncbi:malto-oligosyltrehalose synthase [Limisphaera sp. 4302-co]|uniref:malto-oligosyltrehalose synthase n=1 Tax=Limisphaera sp. 4302-co TaxID=3400417 RepID=UPI003C1FB771